jgi:hypothetical protein
VEGTLFAAVLERYREAASIHAEVDIVRSLVILLGLIGSASGRDLSQLFSRAWQVTSAPETPARGSLYIFLPNGTLLQTSCVETYRIATWTIDKAAPSVLRVVEDKQLAFTATITELTDSTLRLRQNLVRSKQRRDITLKAVEREFVCPDLRK